MKKISNVSARELRLVLKRLGFVMVHNKTRHEAWDKKGTLRPVVFSPTKDPLPTFVVLNCIRDMGVSKADFLSMLEEL